MVSVAVFVMAPFLIYEKARPVERERERERGRVRAQLPSPPSAAGEACLLISRMLHSLLFQLRLGSPCLPACLPGVLRQLTKTALKYEI